MKKLTERIATAILLVFSILFASLSITTLLSTYNTYAIEGDGYNPGHSDGEIADPDAPENPDTPTNPDSPSDPDSPDSDTEGDPPADGEDPTDTDSDDADDPDASTSNICTQEAGILSWTVCPATEVISSAIDALYGIIGDFLVVEPLSMEDTSPIYIVWKYMRSLTNIIFVIFLLIVIFSQVTGAGINNYGVKRVLPRLIIAVILVNLSFLICSLAVDVSNIVGFSLRGTFENIQNSMLAASGEITAAADISVSAIVTAVLGGGMIAGVAIGATTGLAGLFWMLVPVLIGGIVSVVTGLITIAARQALVALLIMISPLAFVAYLLPNTERWFAQWKNLLTRMLIFYPMFSFLFGASQLAGWALIASSASPLGIIIGLAVQIFPLFFSWSLMKMSGTILNSLNTGLRRLAAPVQRSASNWAAEHAERNRQHHLANSEVSGARLRRYLDYRRELRTLDTQNSVEARHNRALERAYTRASSITGRDEAGNTTWERTPNRYTRNAKTANFYNTKSSTARAAYQNTLTGYGRHFSNASAQHLSDQHGEAFLDSMAQQFLTTNEAQADQEWLLNRYLKAATNQNRHRYEYNRLIRDAAGGLGHNGESSIMGQVIVNSSMIENRRRSEARIIATKFGVSKTQMRGMTFDKAHINDNGYETDENGNVIEDTQYRLIEYDKDGNPTGYRRQNWQQYIAVHKKTNAEITKEEYDSMSAAEQDNYKKVRYFDILDDDKNPVQRVYEDDAGYMKELLRDDIAIGDPINRRYLTEIGVKHAEGESTGILRRYHSTISAAMLETKYKEHAAEVTPMITAQANAGYITSIGQYNIANLQSLSVASKAGSFLQNDAYAFNDWAELVQCAFDDDKFSEYFTDDDVKNYRNVNGVHLDGLRWNEATQSWDEINHNDPNITLEDKKNCIKHKIIPKAAAKLVGMLNRDISPAVLDSMKPDNLKALRGLLNTLTELGVENFSETRAAKDRFNNGESKLNNIFDSSDPKILKSNVQAAQAYIDEILGRSSYPDSDDTPPSGGGGGGGSSSDDYDDPDDTDPDDGGGSGGGGGGGGPRRPSGGSGSSSGASTGSSSRMSAQEIQRRGLRILSERNHRAKKAKLAKDERTSINEILDIVHGYLEVEGIDIAEAGRQIEDYIANNDRYENDTLFQSNLHQIIVSYTGEDYTPGSTENAIHHSTHRYEDLAARSSYENIQSMREEIDNLIYNQTRN